MFSFPFGCCSASLSTSKTRWPLRPYPQLQGSALSSVFCRTLNSPFPFSYGWFLWSLQGLTGPLWKLWVLISPGTPVGATQGWERGRLLDFPQPSYRSKTGTQAGSGTHQGQDLLQPQNPLFLSTPHPWDHTMAWVRMVGQYLASKSERQDKGSHSCPPRRAEPLAEGTVLE